MISRRQIQKMVDNKTYWQLVRRILANGRCSNPSVRTRLESPGAAVPAALGLALQRTCELIYGPCEGAADLARQLIAIQRPDGLFGSTGRPSAAASAVALKGLFAWSRMCQPANGCRDDIENALKRGMQALASVLSGHDPQRPFPIASIDRTEIQIIVWQLGSLPQFHRLAPDLALVARTASLNSDLHHEDDLAGIAHAAAA